MSIIEKPLKNRGDNPSSYITTHYLGCGMPWDVGCFTMASAMASAATAVRQDGDRGGAKWWGIGFHCQELPLYLMNSYDIL